MLLIGRVAAMIALGAAVVAPAAAVGLGPLAASGVTRGERKGFILVLINPFPRAERFSLYSTEWDNERPVPRVLIPLADPVVAANAQRRVLVIDTGLKPGEEHKFRVCAERADRSQEGMIHARVCSKITARRVA